MWIKADSKLGKIVDASKLDTIYVMYKGYSNYAIIGTIGDRDIHLETRSTEKDASEFIDVLKAKLEID